MCTLKRYKRKKKRSRMISFILKHSVILLRLSDFVRTVQTDRQTDRVQHYRPATSVGCTLDRPQLTATARRCIVTMANVTSCYNQRRQWRTMYVILAIFERQLHVLYMGNILFGERNSLFQLKVRLVDYKRSQNANHVRFVDEVE